MKSYCPIKRSDGQSNTDCHFTGQTTTVAASDAADSAAADSLAACEENTTVDAVACTTAQPDLVDTSAAVLDGFDELVTSADGSSAFEGFVVEDVPDDPAAEPAVSAEHSTLAAEGIPQEPVKSCESGPV